VNAVPRSESPRRGRPQTILFVEFDGQQLEIRCEPPEILAFFLRTYRPMLVPEATNPIRRLEVRRIRSGYSVLGARKLDFSRDEIVPLYKHLKDEVLVQFIGARPDLLWLHAGAVERRGLALLLPAPSGSGKSTLVKSLCQSDWRLMSDDIAAVRMDFDQVLPFPKAPMMRTHPGREVPADVVARISREEVPLALDDIRRQSAEIGAIVFPIFRNGAKAELLRYPPAEGAFELARNCMNLLDRKNAAFNRLAELAKVVPAYRLTFGNAPDAAGLLGTLSEWEA
jgi:hypothetical protein